jgi:hypothetical protein
VVKRQKLKNSSRGSSLSLYLPADLLRSDLTGLSVQIDGQATHRLRTALQATILSLRDFQGRLNAYLSASFSGRSRPTRDNGFVDDIEEAGFSIFTESLTTSLRKAVRRMPAVSLTPTGGEQMARNFAQWWLELPLELECVLQDLRGGLGQPP